MTRRELDPRCACGHFRSEHHRSPYSTPWREHVWCVAETGTGRPCHCPGFALPDPELADWMAGRLVRWAIRGPGE